MKASLKIPSLPVYPMFFHVQFHNSPRNSVVTLKPKWMYMDTNTSTHINAENNTTLTRRHENRYGMLLPIPAIWQALRCPLLISHSESANKRKQTTGLYKWNDQARRCLIPSQALSQFVLCCQSRNRTRWSGILVTHLEKCVQQFALSSLCTFLNFSVLKDTHLFRPLFSLPHHRCPALRHRSWLYSFPPTVTHQTTHNASTTHTLLFSFHHISITVCTE